MAEITSATRSWLFTPGTKPDRFSKAKEIGADVLIIDLEDAVAPGDKANARKTALDYLSKPGSGPLRVLRINGLDTAPGIADVDALLASDADPDFILLPKTESDGHLRILDKLFTAAKKDAHLIGLIESARGFSNLTSIATASDRLYGLMLGAADMAADLGAETAWAPLTAVRQGMVAACALARIVPIDSPFFNIHDMDGLKKEMAGAKALGFPAKAAIHPAQIAAINDALTPTDDEVAHARKVLEVNKSGVGTVDGEMIDEAVARKARRIVAAAGK